MKKSCFAAIGFGFAMGCIWGITFYNILGKAGAGIGIAMGIPFFFIGTVIFKNLDDNGRRSKDRTKIK